MPLVSIIVPCYNQAQYLDECLQSVVNQTYQDWECIIIDDESLDNTAEVVSKWANKDIRFKYLFQENAGVCKARNLGIHNSNGTFILPLDADDYISENYLEACIKSIENTKSKIVFGRVSFFGEKTNELILQNTVEIKDLLEFNKIHCSGLFRKEDFFKTGGYDENMKFGFEDWELWINILKDGGKAIKANNCILYYRIKDNSRSTEIDSDHVKSNLMKDYIVKKHILCYGYKSVLEMYSKNLELMSILKNPQYYFTAKILFQALVAKFLNKIKK